MSVMTARATAANAAVAMVIAPGYQFQLEEVRIHLSAVGGAGVLTVTEDSGLGATYDTILVAQDMTAVQNWTWIPARPLRFTYTDGTVATSDHIDIAWANAGNLAYGIQVFYSPI